MAKTENTDRYRAPALDKGLDILELLAVQPGGMTRSEIVKTMGRSPSEVYRMIERLVARQYVRRSERGDQYTLSMKLFLLGSMHPPVRRLVAHAQPLMDAFAGTTLQSIHLAVAEEGKAIVIAQSSGPANWEFKLRVGATLDLTATSSGRTLLAFQDKERRAEMLNHILQSNTDEAAQTISEGKALTRELDEIRRLDSRISPSGQLVGVTDISTPVLADDGNAVAVLTCPYICRVHSAEQPSDQLDTESTNALMIEIAKKIAFL